MEGKSAHRHTARWMGLLILACWLLHPILTPAHVEGFSASIVSLALHLNAGDLGDYDRLHPANLEYFTLSRLGTVAWLSLLTGRLALSGEWAMRVTMWIGFAALTTSSYVLARRWTNAPRLVVAAALLLIPGVAESSFFYNDTLFAAALGATALAVLSESPSLVASTASGTLFGAAVVARLDAVLLAPAAVLIAYEQHNRVSREFWLRALVFAIGALVPVLVIPAALNATILDIVGITRYAIVLWGDGFRPTQHARELSLFLGIPAGIFAALGCLGVIRRRDVVRALLLVGLPLLFNVVALGKIWQARQLLPLTPFLTALVVLGWQHVRSESHHRGRRDALQVTVIVICVLTWIAPILVVVHSDGPRAPYGRLWTPPLWRRWQSAASANQAEIRALVNHPRSDSSAIITDTWDADRYLHLALQETGYHQLSFHLDLHACEQTAETFAKDGVRILHIRLHEPFLPNAGVYAAARIEAWAQPCVRDWRPNRLIWLAPLGQLQWPPTDSLAGNVPEIRARAHRALAESNYSPQVAVEVPPYALELLRRAYLAASGQSTIGGPEPLSSSKLLREAESQMAARVWKAPRWAQ